MEINEQTKVNLINFPDYILLLSQTQYAHNKINIINLRLIRAKANEGQLEVED